MILSKLCLVCGTEFFKKPSDSKRAWKEDCKYCSRKCYGASKIGSKPPRHSKKCKCFRCSGEVWNKGMKGFLAGEKHWAYGKKRPEMAEVVREWMKGRTGKDCPNWKGDKAEYGAIHVWIRRHWKKSGICEFCKNANNKSGRTQWANKENYDREDREDWLELCSSCHKKYDLKKKSGII